MFFNVSFLPQCLKCLNLTKKDFFFITYKFSLDKEHISTRWSLALIWLYDLFRSFKRETWLLIWDFEIQDISYKYWRLFPPVKFKLAFSQITLIAEAIYLLKKYIFYSAIKHEVANIVKRTATKIYYFKTSVRNIFEIFAKSRNLSVLDSNLSILLSRHFELDVGKKPQTKQEQVKFKLVTLVLETKSVIVLT